MRILALLATLAIGLYGIERSLWLDEAWVANSVLQPNLSGMFYYPDWLQTTPPLFLLLVRGAVHAFGLSNVTLRIVPLALSLVAVAALIAAGMRLLSPALAVVAGAWMAFQPAAVDYSHTLKQYSGEMAASALILLAAVRYLQDPSRRRFYWLVAAFALLLPLAYSAVFLLPGMAIAVYAHGGIRRAGLLVLSSGAVLAVLYVFLIRPNVSPRLRIFWMQSAEGLTPGLLTALFFCVAAMIIVRSWIVLVAVLPCFLLAATNALQWYPNSPRTRLFVLPGFFLVAMIVAEKTVAEKFRPGRRIVVTIAIALISVSGWKQISQARNLPEEDYAEAVQYLRQHVASTDLLLIHASVKEGFKLYTRMDRWHPSQAIYGDTGYPCCTRAAVNPGTAAADLDAKIPRGFRGRIWLFYSTRPTHWDYVGIDEGQFWRGYVWAKGCPPGAYAAFPNLAIAEMNCAIQP